MTKRNLALTLISFLVFEVLLFFFVDKPLSEGLRHVNPAIIDFFRAYTDYGKSKWYLIPAVVGIAVCAVAVRWMPLKRNLQKKWQQAGNFFLFLFICGAGAGIITDIIKPILGRARPVELDQDGIYGFHPIDFAARWNSMPSGHSTAAFALAFTLAEFFPRWRIPAFILAFALALSRIMVNAHYLSDVLAGAVVAWLTFLALRRQKRLNGIFHMEKVFFPLTSNRALR